MGRYCVSNETDLALNLWEIPRHIPTICGFNPYIPQFQSVHSNNERQRLKDLS